MPSCALPLMASPSTVPEKSSVSGIGWVIDTFQPTSLPFTRPSKICAVWPSADCVPSSLPPATFTTRVEARSPIGVSMVRFQGPSTAMLLPCVAFAAPAASIIWDKCRENEAAWQRNFDGTLRYKNTVTLLSTVSGSLGEEYPVGAGVLPVLLDHFAPGGFAIAAPLVKPA